jgi:hypothetical protein
MINTKTTTTMVAVILVLCAVALGYPGQEKDEARVQEALKEGIIKEHPFPLRDPWKDWVNKCGDLPSYRSYAIKHWQEVAEATKMTAEQRAKAKELNEKFRKVQSEFKETITPARHQLQKRAKEAEKAGKSELANKLTKVTHVQTHQKLAIEGAASEDLLRLLNPKQVKAWHEYRVTKYGALKMRQSIYDRKIGGEKLSKRLAITDSQRKQIDEMAWKLSRETFLPTIKHPEKISAFGVFGEDQKRARALAEEKLYPQVVQDVLTDEQRAKLKEDRKQKEDKKDKKG